LEKSLDVSGCKFLKVFLDKAADDPREDRAVKPREIEYARARGTTWIPRFAQLLGFSQTCRFARLISELTDFD